MDQCATGQVILTALMILSNVNANHGKRTVSMASVCPSALRMLIVQMVMNAVIVDGVKQHLSATVTATADQTCAILQTILTLPVNTATPTFTHVNQDVLLTNFVRQSILSVDTVEVIICVDVTQMRTAEKICTAAQMNTSAIRNKSLAVITIIQTAHQKFAMNQIGHTLPAPTVMDRIVNMDALITASVHQTNPSVEPMVSPIDVAAIPMLTALEINLSVTPMQMNAISQNALLMLIVQMVFAMYKMLPTIWNVNTVKEKTVYLAVLMIVNVQKTMASPVHLLTFVLTQKAKLFSRI